MDENRQAMKALDPLPDAARFNHVAMNTTFSLRMPGMNETAARGVARECFDEVDNLESKFSRFIEGSDISRINRMAVGETLYISEACHECLLLALDAWGRTGGLFDVSLGTRIEHAKSGAAGPSPRVLGKLMVHSDAPAVTCEEPGRELDLGGIGKGFALDHLKRLLVDWGVEDALLAAGASSLLALGPRSWPVDLTGDRETLRVPLLGESLSASGTGVQGCHIVHPEGPQAVPATLPRRVWVAASTAAQAEVWSTALMLVAPGEMANFIDGIAEIDRLFVDDGGRPVIIR